MQSLSQSHVFRQTVGSLTGVIVGLWMLSFLAL